MKPVHLAILLFLLGSAGRSGALTPEEKNTIQAYESVSKSVVFILSRGTTVEETGRIVETWASGSGVIVDSGLVLTNYHVLKNAQQVNIVLPNGDRVDGTLIGTAPGLDLALLKVEGGVDSLPPARLDSNRTAKVGQKVLAIGSPFGLEHSVTSGIVSGLDRELLGTELGPALIQFDAPVNPGQSGGALVDSQGRVIGLITAKLSAGESVGLALPIDIAIHVLPDLKAMGHPFRPQLGFGCVSVTPELAVLLDLPASSGALVQEVTEESPAEKAGLERGKRHLFLNERDYVLGGDLITAIDGIPVEGPTDLLLHLLTVRPGDRVTLEVIGASGRREVRIEIPPMKH